MLVGTSAARDAVDGQAFIDGLGRIHDIAASVISGEEEARLTYAGVSLDVPRNPVVVDVGGGSTELVCKRNDGSLDWVSLNIGASRVTELWLRSDPPTAEEVGTVYEQAREALREFPPRFGSGPDESATSNRILVGVAGTVTTLACLDAGLETYDRAAIHLRVLEGGSVRRLLDQLAGMTTRRRVELPCVQEGRAGVIVGGAAIVAAAIESLGFDQLTVSERDLLDGLIICGAC
jgi:exopolyphosphatase/guanosine-5'-triphosphate,3'-diphosphate pyrophosphatase